MVLQLEKRLKKGKWWIVVRVNFDWAGSKVHWSRRWKHERTEPEKSLLSLSLSSCAGDCPAPDGQCLPHSGKEPILWLRPMRPLACRNAANNTVAIALKESTDATSNPERLCQLQESRQNAFPFYSARNCIASAVLATAIPSVCPSVCPSVRLSVCHTPVLCQNDGT